MTDIFKNQAANLEGPASGAFEITPSDAAIFEQPSRAIYIGGSGNLNVEMLHGGIVTFYGLAGGTMLPIRALRVMGATTASAIVGLY